MSVLPNEIATLETEEERLGKACQEATAALKVAELALQVAVESHRMVTMKLEILRAVSDRVSKVAQKTTP